MQLSVNAKETYDASKLRSTLKMLDTNTNYDDQKLEENFGGNLLRSIEHDVPDVQLQFGSTQKKHSNIKSNG